MLEATTEDLEGIADAEDVVAGRTLQNGQPGHVKWFLQASVGQVAGGHQPGPRILACAETAYQVVAGVALGRAAEQEVGDLDRVAPTGGRPARARALAGRR